MRLDCANLIGGRFEAGATTTENRCPADETVLLGHAPASGAEEMAEAVAAAKAAFPAWADTPAPQRGQLLFRLVRLVEQHTERLATALALEEGKTLGEVVRLKDAFIELLTQQAPSEAARQTVGRLKFFEGVRQFPVRVKCATLIWRALEEALKPVVKAE